MRPVGPGFDEPDFGGFGFGGPASPLMNFFRRVSFVSLGFDGPASSVGLEGPGVSSTRVWASSTRAFEGPAITSTGGSGSEVVSSPDLSVGACAFLLILILNWLTAFRLIERFVPFPFSLMCTIYVKFVPVTMSQLYYL